ncbi:MAG: hypothetical protein H6Q73_2976 [Firmicutes bacterium]|nr:hypothetical protein [Bacillota bacterium]
MSDENTGEVTAATTEVQQVIYCGPSLPAKYGLRQYAVYLNGLPDHVTALIEKCAAIKVLIVDVEKLSAIRQALAKSGSMEAVMYKTIQKAF